MSRIFVCVSGYGFEKGVSVWCFKTSNALLLSVFATHTHTYNIV